MAITITLDDDLVAGLENKAKNQQLSVEQFAIGILKEAVEEPESDSLQEFIARIRATPPNPSLDQTRHRESGRLADCLTRRSLFRSGELEASVGGRRSRAKAITRANDVAEGRGG